MTPPFFPGLCWRLPTFLPARGGVPPCKPVKRSPDDDPRVSSRVRDLLHQIDRQRDVDIDS